MGGMGRFTGRIETGEWLWGADTGRLFRGRARGRHCVCVRLLRVESGTERRMDLLCSGREVLLCENLVCDGVKARERDGKGRCSRRVVASCAKMWPAAAPERRKCARDVVT